ncbi:hypothetical protein ONZ45_g11093 [Pleurotus djamor]|nr:hypothetical protein ONZ45_g11093 [Pleurotus djamor]
MANDRDAYFTMNQAMQTQIPSKISSTVLTDNFLNSAPHNAFSLSAGNSFLAPVQPFGYGQHLHGASLSTPNLSETGSGTSSMSSGPPTPGETSDCQPMMVDSPNLPVANTYADATNLAARYPELAMAILQQPLAKANSPQNVRKISPPALPHTPERPNWALSGLEAKSPGETSSKDRAKRQEQGRKRGSSCTSLRHPPDQGVASPGSPRTSRRRPTLKGSDVKPVEARRVPKTPNSATRAAKAQDVDASQEHLLTLLNNGAVHTMPSPTKGSLAGSKSFQLNADQLKEVILRAYTMGAQDSVTLAALPKSTTPCNPTLVPANVNNPISALPANGNTSQSSMESSLFGGPQVPFDSGTGVDPTPWLPRSRQGSVGAYPQSSNAYGFASNSSVPQLYSVSASDSLSTDAPVLPCPPAHQSRGFIASGLGPSSSFDNAGQIPGTQTDPMLSIFSPKQPRSQVFAANPTRQAIERPAQLGFNSPVQTNDSPNWMSTMLP